MKKALQWLTITLACIFFLYAPAYSTPAAIDKNRETVQEQIWTLEAAYFANLYKADYAAVLALVHSQFLGWPGGVPQPIDKEGSARFMQHLIPKPTACTFTIKRGGIRMLGDVALTHYTLCVNCSDPAGVTNTQASRITHTWVKEGDHWKLLGGMSYDHGAD